MRNGFVETMDQSLNESNFAKIEFFRRIMNSHGQSLTPPVSVVDVGASPINRPNYQSIVDAELCHVYGFEPNQAQFKKLQAEGKEFETYVQKAAGNGTNITLRIYRSPGLTSQFLPNAINMRLLGMFHWPHISEEVEMSTSRLDDVEEVQACDYLKIDIQGGEYSVFQGASNTLASCILVTTEVRYLSLYENEPMFGDVDRILRQNGFVLHKFDFNKSMAVHNSQSAKIRDKRVADQLVDGDATYIRDLNTLANWNTEKVLSLAILSSMVIESHSVCIYALDELVRRGTLDTSVPESYLELMPRDMIQKDFR